MTAHENEEQNEDANVVEAVEHEDASSSSSTDLNILQAMDRITHNITNVIDAKVDTILAAERDQTTQIQALGIPVGEADGRIATVEAMTES